MMKSKSEIINWNENLKIVSIKKSTRGKDVERPLKGSKIN